MPDPFSVATSTFTTRTATTDFEQAMAIITPDGETDATPHRKPLGVLDNMETDLDDEIDEMYRSTGIATDQTIQARPPFTLVPVLLGNLAYIIILVVVTTGIWSLGSRLAISFRSKTHPREMKGNSLRANSAPKIDFKACSREESKTTTGLTQRNRKAKDITSLFLCLLSD